MDSIIGVHMNRMSFSSKPIGLATFTFYCNHRFFELFPHSRSTFELVHHIFLQGTQKWSYIIKGLLLLSSHVQLIEGPVLMTFSAILTKRKHLIDLIYMCTFVLQSLGFRHLSFISLLVDLVLNKFKVHTTIWNINRYIDREYFEAKRIDRPNWISWAALLDCLSRFMWYL